MANLKPKRSKKAILLDRAKIAFNQTYERSYIKKIAREERVILEYEIEKLQMSRATKGRKQKQLRLAKAVLKLLEERRKYK